MNRIPTVGTLAFLALSISQFAEAAGPCANLRDGLGTFASSLGSAAGMASDKLKLVSTTTDPASAPWREVSFALGSLTQAKMALVSYAEACVPKDAANVAAGLSSSLQDPAPGAEFSSEEARGAVELYNRLNAPELGGFAGTVPGERKAALSASQIQELKRVVEQISTLAFDLRNYLRTPNP